MTIPSLKNISSGEIFNNYNRQQIEEMEAFLKQNNADLLVEVLAKGIFSNQPEWVLSKDSTGTLLHSLRSTSPKVFFPNPKEEQLSKLQMQPLEMNFTCDVLEIVRKFRFGSLYRDSIILDVHLIPITQSVLKIEFENEKIKLTPCFSKEAYNLSLRFNANLSEWDAAKVLKLGIYYINQLGKDHPECRERRYCTLTNKRLELAHTATSNKEAFKWLTIDKSFLPK